MVHLRWLFSLVLSLLCAAPIAAQTAGPTPDPEARREIYTALGLGDPVFEPAIWLASAAESDTRTTATWTAATYGALAFVEVLHFDGGYDEAGLRAYFDDDWFAVIFKDYATWERTDSCAFDAVLLDEFSLELGGQAYRMRYWMQPLTPTRVLAFHIVFPEQRVRLLNEYSRRYAPLAYTCAQ